MFINVNASPTDWARDDITSSSSGVTGMTARNAVANWCSTIGWNGVNKTTESGLATGTAGPGA